MGQRLLRMNLLQPMTNQDTIHGRLDAIDELLRDESLWLRLRDSMLPLQRHSPKLDLDKLILQLLSPSRAYDYAEPRSVETKLSQLLSLRALLGALLPARAALQTAATNLLAAVVAFLDNKELDEISDLIAECINEDVVTTRGTITSKRDAKVWAIKVSAEWSSRTDETDVNLKKEGYPNTSQEEHSPLIAVARATYKENISDILTFVQQLAEDTQLPLVPRYTKHGYEIEVSAQHVDISELPSNFIFVTKVKGGRAFTMSTLELKKLNQRLSDSHNEVYLLSAKAVETLRGGISRRVAALYKASEALGLLDMIWSLAQSAQRGRWTRPAFGDHLAVRDGHHPILDQKLAISGGSVPNDSIVEEGANFFVITGANMSGKTTYLQQVALLQIMASIGSFVPARSAIFPTYVDSILTRLSNKDDMEQNLSTFGAEMRATAFVLSLATRHSLVLLDELGRGTSPMEGLSIAHAVSESLLAAGATVFLSTHFHALTDTLSGFPSVVLKTLTVKGLEGDRNVEESGKGEERMASEHRLEDGRSEAVGYGIRTARACQLPSSLLDMAERFAKRLAGREDREEHASPAYRALLRREEVLKLRDRLRSIHRHSQLPAPELRMLLASIQREFVDVLAQTYAPDDGNAEPEGSDLEGGNDDDDGDEEAAGSFMAGS